MGKAKRYAGSARDHCPTYRRVAGIALIGAVVAMAACQGGIRNPGSDANQGQLMIDMADAMNSIREQSAGLQDQVDSLREVVARQDTLLRQLALTAGVPVKP